MAKKRWISVKVGLADPKHEDAMGAAVWLYLHLINNADWESGIIYGYTHADYADKVGRPRSTIRKWYTTLLDHEYIWSEPQDNHLNVTITNWTNPREYSGQVYNPKGQGVSIGGQGGVHEVIGEMDTPPSSSNTNLITHLKFLSTFKLKQFKKASQMIKLHDLEKEYGVDLVHAAIAWAGQMQWNSIDHVLNAMKSALPEWKDGILEPVLTGEVAEQEAPEWVEALNA